MTQDLSASTLEAVRRNMTVMSFMIIVFFFAGGQIPESGVVIKLPLSNVEFTKPNRLLYVFWVMALWWVYRYFTLGALHEFKEGLNKDMASVLMLNSEVEKAVGNLRGQNNSFVNGFILSFDNTSTL